MKVIKSLEDAETSGLAAPVRDLTRRLVEDLIHIYSNEGGGQWDPELDGHVLIIEPGDGDDAVEEAIGYRLADAPLEGVTREDGCYVSCVLWNNEAGLSLVIVDHEGMDPATRQVLEDGLLDGCADG
ncbi:MAG: hypothetical protein P1P84_05400 [Deferrisomatales bacterium]|nr:hypothetical protein [Deferrisomatales bacterium]